VQLRILANSGILDVGEGGRRQKEHLGGGEKFLGGGEEKGVVKTGEMPGLVDGAWVCERGGSQEWQHLPFDNGQIHEKSCEEKTKVWRGGKSPGGKSGVCIKRNRGV